MEATVSVVAIAAGMVMVVGLAVLILRFVDRFTLGPPMTPEQQAEHERQLMQRLHRPRWDELEDHFGFAMPRSLRALYSNPDRLEHVPCYVVPPESTDPDEQHFIAQFEPADVQTVREVWFPIGENRFPFASDDFGNYFYVELVPDAEDAPVFFVDHDGGDVSLVAKSLTEFLKWESHTEPT